MMFKTCKQIIKRFLPGFLVFTFLVSLFPSMALAAESEDQTTEALVFKKLDVSIMPEYDDPRVLIVNEGTLVNKSSKPVTGQVSFSIPKSAEIGMACELVNGGQHSCQPWQKEDNGEYDLLSWKITKTLQPGEEYPVFWEYYYTPTQGFTAPDKTLDIGLISNYPLTQITFSIIQPLKATNVKLNPVIPLSGQTSEGMNLYSITYTDQPAGEKIPLNLSYTKTDPNPSKEKPQDPNSPLPQQGASGASLGNPQVLFPVLIFVLGLAIFVMYFLNKRKPVRRTRKNPDKNELERKKARQLLLQGKITEATYQEILADLED